MRKLTYFVACSADGFIAREDGGLDDFSFEGDHVQDLLDEYPETMPTHLREPLGIDGANRHFDTVLMGRHTYEVGSLAGITSPYGHMKQYVVSRSMTECPSPNVELVSDRVRDLIAELKEQEGMGIWLCGGGILASELAPLIDELVIKSNPFLMGAGKTLFAEAMPRTQLQLKDRKLYDSGFALLRYSLQHDVKNRGRSE